MEDLSAAYENAAHIPGGAAYPERWAAAAAAFRAAHPPETLVYGSGARQVCALYRPAGAARGLIVVVHGGYWMAFGRDDFSHLAAGGLAAGYAVALPGYTLAPAARIGAIGAEVAAAIGMLAEAVPGPIRLAGHSAGGQLVARAVRDASAWRDRVARVVPISPLGDLAPLMATGMNAVLGIDAAEAAAESPARFSAPPVPVTIWVGADERPAFIDQARGLGAAWGARVVQEPGRHHFDVIAGLERGDTALMAALLAE
ncbi:MAG: alpha/beta hydrolase fold [Rhodobacteraceae bacterium HLUCCA08]|nr:MAG: alpha/beta hydrolase fold [Rhodobacteraceae bacterium HLUCCA08]